MPAPVVAETLNDCAGTTTSDVVQVSFTNENISSGVYVIQGTGQKGTVSPYLYLVQGNSFAPATNIHLTCGAVSTTHTVLQITNAENAVITTAAPTAPIGSTFTLNWIPLAGVEQYVVFLVSVSPLGVPHYYGGFYGSTATSATLATDSGDTGIMALVLGFRLCDKSIVSPSTTYVTHA
jgi:hypothetical protein